jgi:hypothetical protein
MRASFFKNLQVFHLLPTKVTKRFRDGTCS